MNRIWIVLLLCAAIPFARATPIGAAGPEMERPKYCQICGMDRSMFASSRMLLVYADNATFGTCSLQCMTTEMKRNRGKKIKSMWVADYGTKKLVDAKTAAWVIGGKKPGVMSQVAKWAFARKKDAGQFVREYGGRPARFGEALKAAESD